MTRTVLITGGARGIGLELARAYLADGWRVVVGVRDPARAAAALPAAEALPLDVTDPASVAALATALADAPLDVLINNAGIIGPDRQSTEAMDFTGFLATFDVNTLGPLRMVQALLPNLRRAPGAKIAIISSRMGSMAYAASYRIAYRTSKAAANKLAQCLATDLAPEGMAVASIHPGWVRTEMGGADADIDAATSAKGIKTVIDRLTVGTTGRFWDYDGGAVAW